MNRREIRFDGWALDRESGDLSRAGARQRLQELPLKVLDLLLANAGGVVTREQLISHLWPKGVVDFDTGLNTAVRKLRVALGDTADTPRYIETLPRRGYRFIATVDPAEAQPRAMAPVAEPATAAVPAAADRSPIAAEPSTAAGRGVEPPPAASTGPSAPLLRTRRRVSGWVLSAIVLLAAAVGAWLAEQSGYFWSNPLADAEFRPVTDFGGSESAASISRDGTSIAFLSNRDGRMDAWLTRAGSGDFQNLTRGRLPELVNPSIRTLGFSPDGASVLVWARQRDGSRSEDINIWAVKGTGDAPLQPYLAEAAEFDWSRDGKRLVYHTTAPGDPLFVRDASGGPARMIFVGAAGVHCHFPIWSPDNEFIYFTRGVPPDAWDIWRIRPTGGAPERITSHDSLVTHPVLIDARTLVYLATDHDDSGPWLYVMDLTRRVPVRVSAGIERYTSLAASADGRRLVVTAAHSKPSLWRVPIREPMVNEAAARRTVLPTGNGRSPRLDAESLVYVATKGEREGIWKLAGETATELWSAPHTRVIGAPAVAPDGRHIAFSAAEGARKQLYVMNADGKDARVLNRTLNLRGTLAWSPDGQSLVSAAIHEGEPRLFKFPIQGDAPSLLVSEYSIDPAWSPDGRFLVYDGPDVGTTFPLRAAAADGRPYALPTLLLTRGARVAFLPGSHALLILRGEIERKNFWLVDLETGTQRQLTDFGRDFVIRDFDIAANGTEIVFDRVQQSSDVVLIERRR